MVVRPHTGIAAALWLVFVMAAHAQDGGTDCVWGQDFSSSSVPALWSVIAPPGQKVYFVRNGSDRPGCPSESAACQTRSFVVSGQNVVVTDPGAGDYICATFISTSAKATPTLGWLPCTALEERFLPAPPRTPGPACGIAVPSRPSGSPRRRADG